MNFIEKIIIECQQQQDATGSDKIKVVKNDKEVFGTLIIKSGQTKTLKLKHSSTATIDEEGFIIDVDDNIKIYEMDFFGKDDLLVNYTIKANDISKGSVVLSHTFDKVDYMFVIVFRTEVKESSE